MTSRDIQSVDEGNSTRSPVSGAAKEDRDVESLKDTLAGNQAVGADSSVSSRLGVSSDELEAASALPTRIAEVSSSPAKKNLPVITSTEREHFENDLGIDDGFEDEDDEDTDSALGSSIGEGYVQ